MKLLHGAECSINPKISETFLKDSRELLEALSVSLGAKRCGNQDLKSINPAFILTLT